MTNIPTKQITKNKIAYFEYEILDTFEAGIALLGSEIKAIRKNKVNLTGSYARIMGNEKPELFWIGGSITTETGQSDRSRKLLIHKKELNTLIGKTQQKGLTLIPLSLYLKRGRAKLSFGLAKGKQLHDKRVVKRKKDLDREARRNLVI
jgi:SsrA-binding protein